MARPTQAAQDDQASVRDAASQLRVWLQLQGLVGRGRLPSERALTGLLRCSRRQVRAALAILDQDGLIQKQTSRIRVISQQTRGQKDVISDTILLVADPSMFVIPGDPRSNWTCHKQLMELVGRLRGRGFTVYTVPDDEHSLNLVCQLLMRRPKAIIINDGSYANRTAQALIDSAGKAGVQTLVLGDNVSVIPSEIGPLELMVFDHAGGVEALVDHAVSRGKRRILRITFAHAPGKPQPLWSQDQEAGFKRACERHGIAYRPTIHCHVEISDAVVDGHLHRHRILAGYLLEHFADRSAVPEVILAGTDHLIPELTGALKLLGYQCGTDIDVYGYDNALHWPYVRKRFIQAGYFPPVTVQADTDHLIERIVDVVTKPWKPSVDGVSRLHRSPMTLVELEEAEPHRPVNGTGRKR